MHTPENAAMQAAIEQNVRAALAEDIGDGDITAALIPADRTVHARVISRESGVVCGRDWVDEVFRQLDTSVKVIWHVTDGETVIPERLLFELNAQDAAGAAARTEVRGALRRLPQPPHRAI